MPEQNDQLEEIRKSLELLAGSVVEMNHQLERQGERIAKLETGAGKGAPISAPVSAPAAPSPTITPAGPPVSPSSVFSLSNQYAEVKPSASPEEVRSSGTDSSLEENIGGKLFARIGMVALVLGISFFLKYAFDNNWVGPAGRVMIGVVAGVILMILGWKFIRKYPVYGQLLSGGGLAVLYLSVFAAFNFYSLIDQLPAFLIMMLITTGGIIISIIYDAPSLIIASVIGGFSTPFLLSNGTNNEFGLFSYVLILDLAVLTVSFFRKWHWLNLVGFLGTFFVFSSWAGTYYASDELGMTMFFLTLFFLVYSISPLAYNLVKREKSSQAEQMLTVLSGSAYFLSSYGMLNQDYHSLMGFFTAILAAYYFFWAQLVRVATPEDENLWNFMIVLVIGFLSLAVPIQFEGKIITSVWIMEAVVLAFLGVKGRSVVAKSFSAIVFSLIFIRVIFIDTHASNDIVFFNGLMLTCLLAVIAAYLIAWLLRNSEEAEQGNFFVTKQIVTLFLIAANFLTIYAVSREINYYYEQEINAVRSKETLSLKQPRLSSGPAYGSFYQDDSSGAVNKLENKNSVTLSLFWLVYGIIMLIYGFSFRSKGWRMGGLALFSLAILKLFFYDLWSLGTLYRIISSMSLGVVLLTISFTYQKYRDKIKEMIVQD